ncbi:hypothetical protein [Nocardia sp. NPDC050175]|uniref:hypothetical protein n=1 Tax=Nocardia sp. NPDC050175 TaxID=3364317 RepID=UPI0037B8D76C
MSSWWKTVVKTLEPTDKLDAGAARAVKVNGPEGNVFVCVTEGLGHGEDMYGDDGS